MTRILLVDDEEDIRNMFRVALEARGYRVDLASGWEEALSLTKTTLHDVVIIDFVLPGVRGLELLQRVRARNPSVRSIIISGQIDHDQLEVGQVESQLKDRILADRYLPKPVPIERLIEAIEEVVSRSQARGADWKQLAQDAEAARAVRVGEVEAVDRELRRSRKRPKR